MIQACISLGELFEVKNGAKKFFIRDNGRAEWLEDKDTDYLPKNCALIPVTVYDRFKRNALN